MLAKSDFHTQRNNKILHVNAMYPAHQARQKIGELIVVGFSPPGLTRAHHRAYLCLLSDGENIFGTRPFEARRKENKCVFFPSQTARVRNIMWGSKTIGQTIDGDTSLDRARRSPEFSKENRQATFSLCELTRPVATSLRDYTLPVSPGKRSHRGTQ